MPLTMQTPKVGEIRFTRSYYWTPETREYVLPVYWERGISAVVGPLKESPDGTVYPLFSERQCKDYIDLVGDEESRLVLAAMVKAGYWTPRKTVWNIPMLVQAIRDSEWGEARRGYEWEAEHIEQEPLHRCPARVRRWLDMALAS